MTPKEMLDVKFEHGDFEEPISFRDFFKQLLSTLIDEEEGFSGKRPFGNSGWFHPLEECLKENGEAVAFVFDMIDEL